MHIYKAQVPSRKPLRGALLYYVIKFHHTMARISFKFNTALDYELIKTQTYPIIAPDKELKSSIMGRFQCKSIGKPLLESNI